MAGIDLRSQAQDMGGIASAQVELGAMTAALNRFPAGFDATDSARTIFGDGLCSAPHWGYVISGTIGVRTPDGSEEFAHAGEVFYLPPGHAPFTREGAEVIEFTPTDEADAAMTKATAWLAQQT